MLYLMGIDWEWIYQRPQIFAEKLAEDYQLTVIFPRSIMKANAELPMKSGIEFRILWTFPYQEKNTLIGKISNKLNAKLFKDLDNFRYIFLGYPLYTRYIPDKYRGSIIYDCMDNYEFLYPDQKHVSNILIQEKRLIQRCKVLAVSSELLQSKMNLIAGYSKSILIRNGCRLHNIHSVNIPVVKDKYQLGYIGTIAGWFNFLLLEQSLQKIRTIEYHLVGPAEVDKKPLPGIIYHGPVPHEQLWEAVKEYDCLIMPFYVNDIIMSVDPVKLYEYIAFGKCIISVYYPEIERFREFVYFYSDNHEYIQLLSMLVEKGFPPKYNEHQQLSFLRNNSWDKRYESLYKEINGISDNSGH